MEKDYQYNEVIAFAEGYYAGRSSGVSLNLYDDDILRIQYDAGYDKGVADYNGDDDDEEPIASGYYYR